ncbi:hypothetical protein CCR85_02215 [Rhodothalassium salexigens]|uniref:hypothetical protein n=1 Tax=Rhodothalassium salexigens TaxID=1086 RepID=UPI0019125CA6|nr:hypothetical protein [Rhodothalassium salexigens]MBK5910304.1 hypothetical protein [Rhodothalassium salexigens]MBK5921083.1 hypothetical protein [Rhodothalassium salexigens]
MDETDRQATDAQGGGAPPLGLFTTAKAFRGAEGTHQTLALKSWAALGLPVALIGDDAGTADAAAAFGFTHVPLGRPGRPRLDHLFAEAAAALATPALCYANADIALHPTAAEPLRLLAREAARRPLLGVARRRNLPFPRRLAAGADGVDVTRLIEDLDARYGTWGGPTSIDLVLFSAGLFDAMPALEVGRIGWDHWALWAARDQGAWVVDASHRMALYHPIHEYGAGGGGFDAYWSDAGAVRNTDLVVGRRLTLDEAATHFLLGDACVAVDAAPAEAVEALTPDPDRVVAGGLKALADLGAEWAAADDAAAEALRRPLVDLARFLVMTAGGFVPFSDPLDVAGLGAPDRLATLRALAPAEAAEQLEDALAGDLLAALRRHRAAGRPLLIHGSGAYGRRALALLRRSGLDVAGVVTPAAYRTAPSLDGLPVHEAEALQAAGPEAGLDGATAPAILVASSAAARVIETYRAAGFAVGDRVLV